MTLVWLEIALFYQSLDSLGAYLDSEGSHPETSAPTIETHTFSGGGG